MFPSFYFGFADEKGDLTKHGKYPPLWESMRKYLFSLFFWFRKQIRDFMDLGVFPGIFRLKNNRYSLRNVLWQGKNWISRPNKVVDTTSQTHIFTSHSAGSNLSSLKADQKSALNREANSGQNSCLAVWKTSEDGRFHPERTCFLCSQIACFRMREPQPTLEMYIHEYVCIYIYIYT